MGEVQSCCNPSTISVDIEPILPLASDILNPPPTVEIITQSFVEPAEEMLQTLRKGQQYLLSIRNEQIMVSSGEAWAITVKQADKTVSVWCRGEKANPLNGNVVLYFPNKQIFKGIVKDNKPIFGVYVFRNNCYYAGEMNNFNAQGNGKFQNEDTGYIYEGAWSKSLPHGEGKQIYSSGDRFQGHLSYGGKYGKGIYVFQNKGMYEGEFYNNQSDGFGKLTFPSGNFYEGQWKLGQFNGKGKFVWANGEVYEGDYYQGKRHGHGKYVFKNGSFYEGGWQNGMQEGAGIIKDKFDEVKGVWEKGQLIN